MEEEGQNFNAHNSSAEYWETMSEYRGGDNSNIYVQQRWNQQIENQQRQGQHNARLSSRHRYRSPERIPVMQSRRHRYSPTSPPIIQNQILTDSFYASLQPPTSQNDGRTPIQGDANAPNNLFHSDASNSNIIRPVPDLSPIRFSPPQDYTRTIILDVSNDRNDQSERLSFPEADNHNLTQPADTQSVAWINLPPSPEADEMNTTPLVSGAQNDQPNQILFPDASAHDLTIPLNTLSSGRITTPPPQDYGWNSNQDAANAQNDQPNGILFLDANALNDSSDTIPSPPITPSRPFLPLARSTVERRNRAVNSVQNQPPDQLQCRTLGDRSQSSRLPRPPPPCRIRRRLFGSNIRLFGFPQQSRARTSRRLFGTNVRFPGRSRNIFTSRRLFGSNQQINRSQSVRPDLSSGVGNQPSQLQNRTLGQPWVDQVVASNDSGFSPNYHSRSPNISGISSLDPTVASNNSGFSPNYHAVSQSLSLSAFLSTNNSEGPIRDQNESPNSRYWSALTGQAYDMVQNQSQGGHISGNQSPKFSPCETFVDENYLE